MLPSITLFGRTYPMYGICCVSGFIASLIVIIVMLRHNHRDLDDAIYIYTLGVVGALIGAKLLYLFTVWPDFVKGIAAVSRHQITLSVFIDRYFSGGLVLYGGLLAGLLTAYLAAHYFGRSLRDFAPVFLPALALLCAIGRIGCFCAGCCYGKPVSWGVVFPKGGLAPAGVPLIPTQLIEAAFDVCLGLVFMHLAKSEKQPAYLLPRYLLSYATFRFIIEFFRGDVVRGILWGLSTSQWISLAVIIAVLCYGFRQRVAVLHT